MMMLAIIGAITIGWDDFQKAWDGMGATFWIPSIIVPVALLVTHGN